MSQPSTHIVYSNRAEHDFWEGGYFIPLVGALIVGFVFFVLCMHWGQKLAKKRLDNWYVSISAVCAVIAALMTYHWLFI